MSACYSHLEFSMSQHCRLGEAVPALHQVNHIQHCQEGQGDVDIAAVTRTLWVKDVGVRRRGGVHVGAGVRDEDLHAAQGAPGERGEAAVHKEGQEETLPVGLPTQRGAQGLLDGTLLRGGRGRKM